MNTEAPILVGGGGHARSLMAIMTEGLRPTYYVDPVQNMPLLWLGDDVTFLADTKYADCPVIITFVAPQSCSMAVRRGIIDRYTGRRFATIIAADAIIEPDTIIGAGSMVFHRAVINTGAFLGDHVIINTGAIIEHDTSIGENTFVGPGAIITGGVTIGRDVYIGAGALLRNEVTIADGVTIGMGAVVTRSITEPGIYVGNPAKRL